MKFFTFKMSEFDLMQSGYGSGNCLSGKGYFNGFGPLNGGGHGSAHNNKDPDKYTGRGYGDGRSDKEIQYYKVETF